MVGGIHATIIPADYAVDGIDIIVRQRGNDFGEIVGRFNEDRRFSFRRCVVVAGDPDFPGEGRDASSSIPPGT